MKIVRKLYSSTNCELYEIELNKNKYIMKRSKKKKNILDHCYIIAYFCINKLIRNHKNLNFQYTYKYFKEKNKNRRNFLLEYNNNAITLNNYINLIKYHEIDRINYRNFLSIFYQIISSILVAQENFYFSHFDLHLSNILLQKCNENSKYNYKFRTFYNEVKSYEYKCIIIDYDFAFALNNETQKFIYNEEERNSKLKRYGYIGIFAPSIDVLKLIFSLLKATWKFKEEDNNLVGFKIKTFCLFILNKFYLIDVELIDNNSLCVHEEMFFCMFSSKTIYKSVLELIEFISKKEKDIFDIFFQTDTTFFPIMKFRPVSHSDFKYFLKKHIRYLNLNLDYLLEDGGSGNPGFDNNKILLLENLPLLISNYDYISLFLRKNYFFVHIYNTLLLKSYRSIIFFDNLISENNSIYIYFHSLNMIYISLHTMKSYLSRNNLYNLKISQKYKQIKYLL